MLDLSRATIVVRSGTIPAAEQMSARVLVEEFDAGRPTFLKRREAEQSEQIEQVGAELRPLMSWLEATD